MDASANVIGVIFYFLLLLLLIFLICITMSSIYQARVHSFREEPRRTGRNQNHRGQDQDIESHEQMGALAGQFINAGLMGNTASDIYRAIELDSDDDKIKRKTFVFIILLSISFLCQLLFTLFTVWRFLYLRNKRAGDPDDDCCECRRLPGCNCWRSTDKALFSITFILVTFIMILQLVSSIVGAVGPLPK